MTNDGKGDESGSGEAVSDLQGQLTEAADQTPPSQREQVLTVADFPIISDDTMPDGPEQ